MPFLGFARAVQGGFGDLQCLANLRNRLLFGIVECLSNTELLVCQRFSLWRGLPEAQPGCAPESGFAQTPQEHQKYGKSACRRSLPYQCFRSRF
jgi:hypothetical protein